MILTKISKTSVVISLFRYFVKQYNQINQKLHSFYLSSLTSRIIKGFRKSVKTYFKYSILGEITEVKPTVSIVLNNSAIVKYLITFLKRLKNKANRYFQKSYLVTVAKDTKKEFNFAPVLIISIIILAAITTNIALSTVLKNQISPWGWMMRGFFLFVAVAGLFCRADWQTIKRSSTILRKIGKK